MSAALSNPVFEIGRDELTPATLAALARGPGAVRASEAARERVRAAHARQQAAAATGAVYGVGTGVGANSTLRSSGGAEHGERLLASHATAGGEPYPADVARAAMVVRANQLAAGCSGVSPELFDALVAAIDARAVPLLHRFGGVGTGDLGPLGELGLALTGAVPWQGAPQCPLAALRLGSGDALALLSSNAVTIAEAALAAADLTDLLAASAAVAALTLAAARGNPQALDARVVAARPYPGDVRAAALLRALLGGAAAAPARLQDPAALRALPQVRGAALDALDALVHALRTELAAGTENPLLPEVDPPVALHHGGWWAGHLGLTLDAVRLALHSDAALSVRRTALLLDPAATGLREFLASGPAASSGAMGLEYVAASALARVRVLAAPASLGTAVLSRGVEDHASFAPEAARATADTVGALRTVVACELVAATRALRLSGAGPAELGPGPLAELYARAAAALPAELADRPLTGDVQLATALLPTLARLAREARPGEVR